MIIISFVLLYLGIVKKFEPLLLVGIAFGCLLTNLSYFVGQGANALYHPEIWAAFLDETSPAYHSYGAVMRQAGLLDFFYIGVKAGIYPSLIFMGVGAMTDFGPLLANPKSLLLGAAAQLGVFVAFFGPAPRLPPSASSAALTAPPPSSSPRSWPRSCSAPSPSRLTPTWP